MDAHALTAITPLAVKAGDAPAITGLSRSRLYQAMSSGELPFRMNGNHRVLLMDDLRRYLESLPTGDADVA